jgi:hypothetical protein
MKYKSEKNTMAVIAVETNRGVPALVNDSGNKYSIVLLNAQDKIYTAKPSDATKTGRFAYS